MRPVDVVCVACALALGAGSAAHAQDEPRTHVVEPGETLSHISEQYYGTARHAQQIADANGITDPRTIRPGQRLIIPPAPAGPPPRDVPPEERPPRVPRPTVGGPVTGLPEELRAHFTRVFADTNGWQIVLALPFVYVFCVLSYWVGSNVVHVERMSIRTAATCGLLILLVWLGCGIISMLLWLAVVTAAGAAPSGWAVLAIPLAASLVSVIGTLIVVRLVYRESFGKTVALWVVSTILVGFVPVLLVSCCASPFAWMLFLSSGS